MNLDKEYKQLRWLVLAFWSLIILGFILAFGVISTTMNEELPSFEQLENPQYDLASIVYDTKERPFGKYYVENREQITFDELSPNVLEALLATEDIRFFRHSGVDIRALFRVALKTILLGKESSGGGSTISQQLAKLLFKRESLHGKGALEKATILLRTKVKEWITAVRLEKSYTKEEIITMYLNKFEFINGAHGIQAAAQTYFDKNQDELTIEEAAMLVGMLKNPSLYNPLRFPENATIRRNIVLNQLKKYSDIDLGGIDTIMASQVDMSKFERDAHDVGPAPFFRAELTKWLKKTLEEKNIRKADGSEYNIYTDGLKIYTTIDLDYQAIAENTLFEHMQWNQERYWRVWKYKNPWTFEADDEQRKIRKEVLMRKNKESQRYLALHDRYLGSLKENAMDKFGVTVLSENVIKSMMRREKINGSWEFLVETDVIQKHLVENYKKLEKSPQWSVIKNAYDALQTAFEEEFSREIPMKVFDYNEKGYKEVVMSPFDSVRYHNQHLQGSFLAVDPRNGHIKAWVGGVGFNYFKYDHVNSRRQVGSTIKPFVYATAISLMGISPCQEYEDIQYTIAPGDANFLVDKEWSPSNANEEFTGNKYNLYQGLLYSKNSITVRLVKEMGNVDVIREMLDNVGISKDLAYPNGIRIVPRVPSICLGAMDLTLYEMTGAYTAFANDGIYSQPIFVNRIEDKNGKVIYSGVAKRQRAINPLYNGVMVDMLKNNIGGQFGLGIDTEIGGKTGTTNDYADGWFMCITPELVTGVWVGGDDKWIRFLTLDDGQGFVMARPVIQKFYQALQKDTTIGFDFNAQFPEPPAGYLDLVDCSKYKQIDPVEEQFLNQQKKRSDEFEAEFIETFDEEELFDGGGH